MKKADIILLSVLLVIGITGCVIFIMFTNSGANVKVVVDGKEVAIYPLQKDGEYLIKTDNGGENLLKIEGGFASVVSANCPNQDCVYHKAVSVANESIICLPHKVVITVYDAGSENALDARVQ